MPEEKHFIGDIVQKAVIDRGGKVLLVWEKNHDDPLWSLPGGRLNEGEEPKRGIVREIHEELAMDIQPMQVLAVYTHIPKPEIHHFFVIWECAWRGDNVVPYPGIREAKWVSAGEYEDLSIFPKQKEILQNHFTRNR